MLGKYIRGHWAIENCFHWVLDVVFKEDESRIRNKNAPKNMVVIRSTALNIVKKDQTKGSMRNKLKRTGWSDDYMLKVLSQNF